jgi:hypothetical protein
MSNPFKFISGVRSIFAAVVSVSAFIAWFKGIFPVLYRLGNGLAKRKIALFVRSDNFSSLRGLLVDSKLFSEKNIMHISTVNDIKKSERASLFLVYWPDWENDIDKIINMKKDSTALIVYAPQDKGFLDKSKTAFLDKERNTVLTNFRGRLLNDIVISMITTGLGN